ncbi:hypothetical protein FHX76_001842 [Lysinibacter cavernae]|uniref:Uncharacterized protein n=1 Tax=Lysinibacter cavernae TaxID=1640652 RepID=A0A7X5R1P9_9MICO|nr:hypothetical protein [Lysinibacter cavernae]
MFWTIRLLLWGELLNSVSATDETSVRLDERERARVKSRLG